MSKHIGDIGELEFILGSKKRGHTVLLPYSSICPYDIMIDTGDRLLKIQVKTCNVNHTKRGEPLAHTYKATMAKGNRSKIHYAAEEVDFFAVYILPEHIFYIVPFHEITAISNRFYPNKESHKFSKYRENWDQLKGLDINT